MDAAAATTTATTAVTQISSDMTSLLELKVIQMLDALQNGAAQIGDQVVKYTPDMIQAVMGVTVISGLQQILYGLIWLGLLIPCFWYWKSHKMDTHGDEDDISVGDVKIIATGLISIVCFIGMIVQLSNIWNWTAIFYPKLFIAHQIIEKALATAQSAGH